MQRHRKAAAVLSPVDRILRLVGMAGASREVTYMFHPANPALSSGRMHYLYRNGAWADVCPLTAGSMAATGEITGGCQSISVAGTVESFSVIWNNAGLPVVAFSIGYNRALTTAERAAHSSPAFWAAILPAAINVANCTSLYPFLAPCYQSLVGWWDADAITGLANNDPVTTWLDRSGLGNHVTQSGLASLKPTYLVNQQNGLPALSLDGGDYLLNHAVASYFSGRDMPLSCIVAMRRSGTAVSNPFSFGNTAGATGNYFGPVRFANATTQSSQRKGSTTEKTPTWVYGAGSDSHICSFVFNGTTISAWANGVSKVAGGDCAVGQDVTLNTFAVGGFVSSSASPSFAGLLHSILLYKSALSDADRAIIQTYLSTKWGIALS